MKKASCWCCQRRLCRFGRAPATCPTVKTLLSGYINVRDLLGHDTVVLTQDAVDYIEIWLGADVAEEVIEEEVELVASAVLLKKSRLRLG